MKQGFDVDADPEDLEIYSADAVFSGGSDIGGGNYVVYDGTGSSVTVTGLSSATQYSAAVFEYNGANGTQNYLTVDPATGSGYTLATEPATQASSAQLTQSGTRTMALSWSAGDGGGQIVLMSEGAPVGQHPVDGVDYTASSSYGAGDGIGSGIFVVYKGSGTVTTVTDLSPETTYHVAVYAYNGSGATTNYLQAVPATDNLTMLALAPTASASDIEITPSTHRLEISWTPGDGANRLFLMNSGSQVTASPVDGESYSANASFDRGTLFGDGSYAVYNGPGSSVSVTGLTTATPYHLSIFEYNGSGATTNYRTPGTLGSGATRGIINVSTSSSVAHRARRRR